MCIGLYRVQSNILVATHYHSHCDTGMYNSVRNTDMAIIIQTAFCLYVCMYVPLPEIDRVTAFQPKLSVKRLRSHTRCERIKLNRQTLTAGLDLTFQVNVAFSVSVMSSLSMRLSLLSYVWFAF